MIQRTDALLSVIAEAVSDIRDSLLPERTPLPRYAPLTNEFINDAMAMFLTDNIPAK